MNESFSGEGVPPSHCAIELDHDSPELAATYDQVSSRQFENGKLLISALNIRRGESVLDIGAGTGRLAAFVADIVGPSGHVIGVDPLPLRIEIARTRASSNFEARIGQAENLAEFATASFDVAYLNSVFHWIMDKPRALAEIFRVLKPDGRLGLNCHDTSRPHEARLLIRQALAEAGVEADHRILHPSLGLACDELEALVIGAGFTAYSGELRTFVDAFPDADALIDWSSSSTFGNFLIGISAAERVAVRSALGRLLEPNRSPNGFLLERYLRFATASKPKSTRAGDPAPGSKLLRRLREGRP